MLHSENQSNKATYFAIAITSALILIPFTGNVHLFDWDEINFAECAREMIISKNYHTVLLNFQPFWEKPPLFIWMQVLSMKIFGINEFAARFPNILNGILSMCFLYYLGKKWYSEKFGLLWASIHLGSILPHLYFRSGIIDPWYNLFGFIAFVSIIEILKNKNTLWTLIGGLCLGLSVLTKGPAMVLIVSLSALLFIVLYKKFVTIKKIHLKYLLVSSVIFIFISSSWFLYEYISGRSYIIKAFIDYQIRLLKTEDSGHGGFLLYHFFIVLIGCFPASVFVLKYFSKKMNADIHSAAMMILMFVVLILFSIVKTKIVHYSSMSYYSISFLASYVLINNNEISRWQKYFLLALSFIIGTIIVLAGTIEHWKDMIIPYLEANDMFAAENLKVNVKWYNWEFLLGFVLVGIVWWYTKIAAYSYLNHVRFFGMIIVWISITLNNYIGKVEQYTQHSAVVFFKWCAEKNYEVDTYGYKSYAHLFYGNRTPLSENEKQKVENYLKNLENAGYNKVFSYNLAYLNWLIEDEQKYPVYLVCKIQDEENLLKTKKFKKLYSKGGYVFFMKQKQVQ